MNDLKAYVDSLIPANLPKSKKELLYDEIEGHILEKADFYEEIGYPRKESMEMAIKDFGTDEDVKDSIFGEFETLYYERTWWAIPAAIAVFAMNFLAFRMDIWVGSADYNQDPDSGAAFTSFCMIFFLLGGIVFARIKNYRKLLVGLGLGSLATVASIFLCLFPQAAFYAISINIIYLIDMYTPFSMAYFFEYGVAFYFFGSVFLLVLCSLYCFITAYGIKTGSAKEIKNAGIKATAFVAAFFIIAFASSSVLPKAQRYYDDYHIWFNTYNNHISNETDFIYGTVNIGDSYNEVAQRLAEYGWTSFESYEKTLDKLGLKHFRAGIRDFNFDENDEIWFLDGNRINGEYIGGNNFVALQKDTNGLICKKAVGDIGKDMYNRGFSYLGNGDGNDRMLDMMSDFANLKKGISEQDVLSKFGKAYGEIYTKNTHLENGSVVTYYRVVCNGLVNPDGKSYEKYGVRHIELTFRDGYLTQGKMWWNDTNTGDVLTQEIEK